MKRQKIWSEAELNKLKKEVMAHAEAIFQQIVTRMEEDMGPIAPTIMNLMRNAWFLDGYVAYLRRGAAKAKERENLSEAEANLIKNAAREFVLSGKSLERKQSQ